MKFPNRTYLFYTGDCATLIFYSCLRLHFSTLNQDRFKKNCSSSSVCHLCGALVEDVKHYFLFCPSFAALHKTLFSFTANLLGDEWLFASDKRKIDFLLNGDPGFDFQINVNLFHSVFHSCFFVFVTLLLSSVTINNLM